MAAYRCGVAPRYAEAYSALHSGYYRDSDKRPRQKIGLMSRSYISNTTSTSRHVSRSCKVAFDKTSFRYHYAI